MPIYEYECTKCGKIEEMLQKFSDKPLTRCRSCAGKLHKLVSQSTFHLKGTGWYATDYANKTGSPTKPSKKNQTSKSAETKSPETGSESKEKSSAKENWIWLDNPFWISKISRQAGVPSLVTSVSSNSCNFLKISGPISLQIQKGDYYSDKNQFPKNLF